MLEPKHVVKDVGLTGLITRDSAFDDSRLALAVTCVQLGFTYLLSNSAQKATPLLREASGIYKSV